MGFVLALRVGTWSESMTISVCAEEDCNNVSGANITGNKITGVNCQRLKFCANPLAFGARTFPTGYWWQYSALKVPGYI